MIYPKFLNDNSKIKIISPSNGVTKNKKIERLELGKQLLVDEGFSITEDSYVRNSINGESSSSMNRAKELKNSIKENTNCLIAVSGGDYSIEIFNHYNLSDIKKNIKWIQGHSDITPILYYITTKYDIATIYSYNFTTFGNSEILKEQLEYNINTLKGNIPIQKSFNINTNWTSLDADNLSFEGRIIGGCLDCLLDIVGTKFDYTKKFIERYKSEKIIWYFDVANLSNEAILRGLWQLKNSSWFKNCVGILFGRLDEEISYTGISKEEAIKRAISDLDVKVITNVDLGHTDPVITIINGSYVKLSLKNGEGILESILK